MPALWPWSDSNASHVRAHYGWLWTVAEGQRHGPDDFSMSLIANLYTTRTRGSRQATSVPFLFSYDADARVARIITWATSQKGQRRVQMSPRIMIVAVPAAKTLPTPKIPTSAIASTASLILFIVTSVWLLSCNSMALSFCRFPLVRRPG